MHFAVESKAVTLSVGEFAAFRSLPSRDGSLQSGLWRAEMGRQWHSELEKQTKATHPGARFEVPLEVTALAGDWKLHFQGRMDQWIEHEDAFEIVEVKTVTISLPTTREDLLATYPEYLNQLSTYCQLAAKVPGLSQKTIRGTLCFVEIQGGIQQRITLNQEETRERYESQVEELLPFLNSRWKGFQRRLALRYQAPFTKYREGQRETQSYLNERSSGFSRVLLEAPTGFGKTGIGLEYALGQMKAGLVERIIYLTSKSTGQVQTLRQLDDMLPPELDPPRYFQIRNRKEHGMNSWEMPYGSSLKQLWEQSGLHPVSLLEDHPTLRLETILLLGEQTGLPPYEITRAALPYADLWLCDVNYVFSQHNRLFLEAVPGFNPGKTLLLVDEAHNLPSRAADALSGEISQDRWESIYHDLLAANCPPGITAAVDHFLTWLDGLKPCPRLDTISEYECIDFMESLSRHWMETPLQWDTLNALTVEGFFELTGLRRTVLNPNCPTLLWVKNRGTLKINCLDASYEVATQVNHFAQTLFMSATLQPFPLFKEQCGITEGRTLDIQAPAPWRDAAYQIAVDLRVDTRYQHRETYYSLTAETLYQVATASGSPVAVFFSSYRYADTIEGYLKAAFPVMRIAKQPRGLSLREQVDFIEQALMFSDLLFLVLGTGFSEGIDMLGGRVHHAVVVGPALPEVNPVQDAKMDALSHKARDEAFRLVYQLPAMQKINQALGRLVRAPGQSAKVLLHGKRLAQSGYESLLAPEYQGGQRIQSPKELMDWLS